MDHEPDGTARWREAVPGTGQVPLVEILRTVAEHHPDLYIALENPVAAPPGESHNRSEILEREWNHLVASAKAAREILARV